MDSNHSTKRKAIELLSQCDAFDRGRGLGNVHVVTSSIAILGFGRCNEVLERRSVFVGSSRLPRKLDEIPRLFDGLLKLAVQLNPDRDVLLTGEATTCDAMVRRVSDLFRIPVVELILAPLDPSKLNSLVAELAERENSVAMVVDFEERGIDFALASFANQMTVFSMRKNGKLHAAVSHRLSEGKATRVLAEPSLTKKGLTDELLSSGATGWYLFGDDESPESFDDSQRFCSANELDSEKYLLHWTRRRVGPWPEQSDSEFLDDLIFRSSRKDHREIAALKRILLTERLIASNALTRDPRPVVCFSNVTFAELKKRRVFRSHLSRWDFEPYGIAIEKTWLAKFGCNEVTYGDDAHWDSLAEADRPFFQRNDHNKKVDWSVEKEWRILDDVDLRKVPVDAAVVFVPTEVDAREIAGVCRWPIVLLQS